MTTEDAPMTDDAELSRLLYECREVVEMWADVVAARAGREDDYLRQLITRVDTYRTERGWSPHGFGGES